MIQRQSSVLDQYDRPVPGAEVYVYDSTTNAAAILTSDGVISLTQPVETDEFGVYSYWADTGVYREEIRYGGKLRYREAGIALGSPQPPTEAVATRSVMAAVTGMVSGNARRLSEAGREGTFVFRSTNFQALFGASLAVVDPNQGIYVAPASDVTGASGAWVRSGWTSLDARWFGAVFDNATNDAAAIAAAIALSKALAVNVSTNGFYKAGPEVKIPSGTAYMGTTTIEITHTLRIRGDGSTSQQGSAYASCLRWAHGATGIRVQRFDTSGASTTDAGTHFAGDGSSFIGLRLTGGYVATEGEYHGIHTKGRCIVRDCYIDGWSGDGFYCHADSGAGPDHGNANVGLIDNLTVTGCRDGTSFTGGDANAWDIRSLDTTGNRRWGRFDTAFLCNTYLAGHAADNGLIIGQPPSVVSNGGNRYAVVYGAEATASVTAPVGTADTVNWLYLAAGGVNAPLNIPAWVSGMTLRAGGAAYFANANSDKVVAGFYTESGQGPVQGTYPTTILGGTMGYAPRGTLSWIRNYLGFSAFTKLLTTSDVTLKGPLTWIGPDDPTAFGVTDNAIALRNTNATNDLGFESYAGGVPSVDGYLRSSRGNGMYLNGKVLLTFRNNGADIAAIGPSYVYPTTDNATDLGFNSTTFRWRTLYAMTGNFSTAVTVNGPITSKSATGGVGYETGAGGTVTQATSKATAPAALNKACGEIVLNNAALAANTVVSFTFSNSSIAAGDELRLWVKSGEATPGSYLVTTSGNGAGTRTVCVRNLTAGSLSEAVVVGFAVGKVVVA